MKKLKIFSTALFISLYLTVFTLPVRAFACDLTPGGGISFLNFPTWYKYLQGEEVAGKCTPVIKTGADLTGADIIPIVVALVEILLRIIGIAAVAYVVYGGFKYVTSQGQPDSTKQARQTIQNALIGVIISIVASVAVSFFGRAISS